MKNLFIGLLMLAGTASFANNSVNNTELNTKNTEVKTTSVAVSCSARKNGVTYTVTCACTNCIERLQKVLAAV
jgi:hypothetical protein